VQFGELRVQQGGHHGLVRELGSKLRVALDRSQDPVQPFVQASRAGTDGDLLAAVAVLEQSHQLEGGCELQFPVELLSGSTSGAGGYGWNQPTGYIVGGSQVGSAHAMRTLSMSLHAKRVSSANMHLALASRSRWPG
jgi:hypothetical protein